MPQDAPAVAEDDGRMTHAGLPGLLLALAALSLPAHVAHRLRVLRRRPSRPIASYGYYRGHRVVCFVDEDDTCERFASDLALTVGEDGVRIQDLKSKNGTQVNGVPVVEAPLKDGDRILLGKFQITLARSLEGKVVLDEAKPLSEEAGTIIRSVGELSKLLAAPEAPPRPRRRPSSATSRPSRRATASCRCWPRSPRP